MTNDDDDGIGHDQPAYQGGRSMGVTVNYMVLARSHGSLLDLLSTRCVIELN
jgi:hypothetical protein